MLSMRRSCMLASMNEDERPAQAVFRQGRTSSSLTMEQACNINPGPTVASRGKASMTFRSTLASGALLAATAAVVLTSAMAIPGVSSAQPYGDPYADQQACQQQQQDRTVGGAILGGLAGAAIGNSVSRGNRAGGPIIGGVAGAAVRAGVGSD